CRNAIRTHMNSDDSPCVTWIEPDLISLSRARDDLHVRIDALRSTGESPAYRALVAERDGLSDREWLGKVKTDVLAERARQIAIKALEECGRSTATNRITTKSGELARTLVTNTLRAQFAQEVNKLGVAGLAIELQQARTEQGIPQFR